MATVLKEFDFGTNGSTTRYPWKEWADGQIRELKEGDDFTCKTHTMAMMARGYAKKNNLRAKVKADKANGTCVLQFVPMDAGQGQGNTPQGTTGSKKRK